MDQIKEECRDIISVERTVLSLEEAVRALDVEFSTLSDIIGNGIDSVTIEVMNNVNENKISSRLSAINDLLREIIKRLSKTNTRLKYELGDIKVI